MMFSISLRNETYPRDQCAVFRKAKETWGGLSNMASEFPLSVNAVPIKTVEAIYQACRFPHLPDVQKEIIEKKSPLQAKWLTRKSGVKEKTRSDWDSIRIDVMGWCLRLKLAQNWDKFGALLRSTQGLEIVEESANDSFWGAKPEKEDPNKLNGTNALGRLLMELRREYLEENNSHLLSVMPLPISNFCLY